MLDRSVAESLAIKARGAARQLGIIEMIKTKTQSKYDIYRKVAFTIPPSHADYTYDGFAEFSYASREPDFIELDTLAVRPGLRGNGLSRILFASGVAYAQAQDFPELRTHAVNERTAALFDCFHDDVVSIYFSGPGAGGENPVDQAVARLAAWRQKGLAHDPTDPTSKLKYGVVLAAQL